MLDAWHALEETAASGDDQCIVMHFALVGNDGAAAILEAGDGAGAVIDPVFFQEGLQRQDQVFAAAQAGRNPDQAG